MNQNQAMQRNAVPDLMNQHAHRAPDQDTQTRLRAIRQRTLDLALFLEDALPHSREKALAQTKLDECRMWACNAATLNGEVKEPLECNRAATGA